MRALPSLISKTFYKVEEGEITIHIRVDQISEITNQISLAIIIAALLIGSSLVMLIDVGSPWVCWIYNKLSSWNIHCFKIFHRVLEIL